MSSYFGLVDAFSSRLDTSFALRTRLITFLFPETTCEATTSDTTTIMRIQVDDEGAVARMRVHRLLRPRKAAGADVATSFQSYWYNKDTGL